MTVHHGHDKDMVRFNREKNRIRKNLGQTTANIGFEKTMKFRVFDDTPNGLLNAIDEAQIQVVLTGGIELGGLLVFRQSFGMEIKSHRPTERRT